jgi:hypothetical protein
MCVAGGWSGDVGEWESSDAVGFLSIGETRCCAPIV